MWNFDGFKKNIAGIDERGNSISYADLIFEADRFARHIKPRSLVFLLCENSIGSMVGYISFLSNKAVPLLLDSGMEHEFISNLTVIYKPSYIWQPEGKDTDGYRIVLSAWGYNLLQTDLQAYPLYNELALLVTTSGSTGSPKLVRQSYKNIESNTRSIAEYLKIDKTERPITILPMNYVYGTSIINSHLSQGATILLTRYSLMQKEFWKFFKDYKATSISGVPYTYEMLKKLRLQRMDLPSLRTMTQAGGKLHPDLHKEFAEYADNRGINFVIMYGAAEATARMGYLPPDKALEKYGYMGIAIPGGYFDLTDDTGNIIDKPDIVGELVYYGDNVTLGYAECGEDLANGDERYGRYETGDMAKRDNDGYYMIVGRKKRFLKIFGNRVGLDETERMLKAAFPDIDCVCSGVDDKMTVFTATRGTEDSIIEFLASKTSINPTAFNSVYIDKIPRNDAGKVLYGELEKKI